MIIAEAKTDLAFIRQGKEVAPVMVNFKLLTRNIKQLARIKVL